MSDAEGSAPPAGGEMGLNAKRWLVAALGVVFLASLVVVAWVEGGKQRAAGKPRPVVSGESQGCVQCHDEKTPAIVDQWRGSTHARLGVGCYECHGASEQEPDAWRHEGKVIATIVTPKDCARCHAEEQAQFAASHHAKAAQFVGSLDNFLGEIVEGRLAAANGCQQCHGATIALKVGADGKPLRDKEGKPSLDPLTWPNTGIGRVNLDGSLGSCTACHSRHAFAREVARQPETCGKCHMGPDHPQIEIFEESKHGIAYRTHLKEMNLDAKPWVVGRDYTAAPTCTSCHMSATPNFPVTHDVGERISWTLRPVISTQLENADQRRARMKDSCHACHGPDFVDAFYVQFDASVELWNGKFARPAKEIMDALRARNKLTPTPFDDEIEWTFYFLWHHEGRRARMGVSMQGPDYTQWHGFFEVAHRFYFELIPQARELARGDAELTKLLDGVMAGEEHRWTKGLPKEEWEKIRSFYEKRYGQK